MLHVSDSGQQQFLGLTARLSSRGVPDKVPFLVEVMLNVENEP